jgi:hypothetical protein
MLRNQMMGVKTRPSDNPGNYEMVPWNSFTFEDSITTTSDNQAMIVTVASMAAQVSRLAGPGATDLAMKVHSAQIWATSAGPAFAVPTLNARFMELASPQTTPQPRSIQFDRGTLNMPAKAGYRFPAVDTKEVLDNSGTSANQLAIASGAAGKTGTAITIRVQLLWRNRASLL